MKSNHPGISWLAELRLFSVISHSLRQMVEKFCIQFDLRPLPLLELSLRPMACFGQPKAGVLYSVPYRH